MGVKRAAMKLRICLGLILASNALAQNRLWPTSLQASVVYSPSGIGVGSFSEPNVMEMLYGWQGRDVLSRDISLIGSVIPGATIIVPIGSESSMEYIVLRKSLCTYAKQAGIRLVPAISLMYLVEGLANDIGDGLTALLADKALIERAMVAFADSIETSGCSDRIGPEQAPIIAGIILGGREDQIIPTASADGTDSVATTTQAQALYGDAIRFLRGAIEASTAAASLPILLHLNLEQAGFQTWSSMLPLVRSRANSATEQEGNLALFDGVILYVGSRGQVGVPTLDTYVPQYLMAPPLPGEEQNSLQTGGFNLVVVISESAYDATALTLGMDVDMQRERLRLGLADVVARLSPRVLNGSARFPTSEEVAAGQVLSGIVVSEVKDQLWRVAAADGVVACDITGEGRGASPWFFDSACFEQQVDPQGSATARPPRSAVQRQGLFRQFEGGRNPWEVLSGPEVCLRPRPAASVASCAMRAIRGSLQQEGSAPYWNLRAVHACTRNGGNSSTSCSPEAIWEQLGVDACYNAEAASIVNKSTCTRLDALRTLPGAPVAFMWSNSMSISSFTVVGSACVLLLSLSYLCYPVSGVDSSAGAYACHARPNANASKAYRMVETAIRRGGCCLPLDSGEAQHALAGILNPVAGAQAVASTGGPPSNEGSVSTQNPLRQPSLSQDRYSSGDTIEVLVAFQGLASMLQRDGRMRNGKGRTSRQQSMAHVAGSAGRFKSTPSPWTSGQVSSSRSVYRAYQAGRVVATGKGNGAARSSAGKEQDFSSTPIAALSRRSSSHRADIGGAYSIQRGSSSRSKETPLLVKASSNGAGMAGLNSRRANHDSTSGTVGHTKMVVPGCLSTWIEIYWKFQSTGTSRGFSSRPTGAARSYAASDPLCSTWEFNPGGELSMQIDLRRCGPFLGGAVGFRTHADAAMRTVSHQVAACMLILLAESDEANARCGGLFRTLVYSQTLPLRESKAGSQLAQELGLLLHDATALVHWRLFSKAKNALPPGTFQAIHRIAGRAQPASDIGNGLDDQPTPGRTAELLRQLVLYHLVFSYADTAAHAPATVSATVRRMIASAAGTMIAGEGAATLRRAFNQTNHHMHVVPQRTVYQAQAWGSYHRTNFDDIEDSWIPCVPPRVASRLLQAYDRGSGEAAAAPAVIQQEDMPRADVPTARKRKFRRVSAKGAAISKEWSEARGPDVVLDFSVVFRYTLLQWFWVMAVAGILNISFQERVEGGRVQTTDTWKEIREWLLTVALVESTGLGVAIILSTICIAARQGDCGQPSAIDWLYRCCSRLLAIGRPGHLWRKDNCCVYASPSDMPRSWAEYLQESMDVYADIGRAREALDAIITVLVCATLRVLGPGDLTINTAMGYAAYRILAYVLQVLHDLLVCIDNTCCLGCDVALFAPARHGRILSPCLALFCGLPDLGGEAQERKRDGCRLSVLVLVQRAVLTFVLSVSVAPFFLNATGKAFCQSACDAEVLPNGIYGESALEVQTAQMGDGIVWEHQCQVCQMGATVNAILGALSVPYLDFMVLNLAFCFSLVVISCSQESSRLCLYCSKATASVGELHSGMRSMSSYVYAAPLLDATAATDIDKPISDEEAKAVLLRYQSRHKRIAKALIAAGVADLRERDLIGDKDHNRIVRWATAHPDLPEATVSESADMSPLAYRRLVAVLNAARRGILTLGDSMPAVGDYLDGPATRSDYRQYRTELPYATVPEAGSVLIPAYGEPILANTTGRTNQGGEPWWAFRVVAEQGPVEGLEETILVQRALQFPSEWEALCQRWKRYLRSSSAEILQQLQRSRIGELEQKCLWQLGIELSTHFEQTTSRPAGWAAPTASTAGTESMVAPSPLPPLAYTQRSDGTDNTGVRRCRLRYELTATEMLVGVHSASALLRTNYRALAKIRHPRHQLYYLLRAAESAAQLWISERTQTVGRTLLGAASYFESLEAYAQATRNDDEDGQIEDRLVHQGIGGFDAEMGVASDGASLEEAMSHEHLVSQGLFQVVLSHYTIGGMKWTGSGIKSGNVGKTENYTTADRLVGLLASHPRLRGRNVLVVTTVELSGLKDNSDLAETGIDYPFDKLWALAVSNDQYIRYGNSWFSLALVRGVFARAQKLGVLSYLEAQVRTTGEMRFAVGFRIHVRAGLDRPMHWSLDDPLRWPGSPLLAGERQQVEVEVVQMIYRHAPLRLGKGLWATYGKAANQSMGLRFVTGHFCFTLDCNQDGWVFETQKIPLMIRKTMFPRVKAPRGAVLGMARFVDDPSNTVTLVGLPEEIVTESVSPVASAEAVAESVFGRLQQRIFDYVAGLRMHYGHPDAWNTHYVRGAAGALSKASPQLNLSEDVFSGFIVAAKGYTSRHSDLLVWGKGREEVFLNALSFKFKISAGSGGVLRSRDMHQLTMPMSMHKNFALFHSLFGFFATSGISYVMAVLLGLALAMSALSGQTSASLGGLYLSFASPWVLQAGALPIILVIVDRCLQGEVARMFKEVFWSPLCLYHSAANEIVGYAFVTSVLAGEAGYVATGRGPSGAHVSWLDIARGMWVLLLRSVLQIALAGATMSVQSSGFFTISGLLVMLNGILVIMSAVAYSPHWWGNILGDASVAWETLGLGQTKRMTRGPGSVSSSAMENDDFVFKQFAEETMMRHPLGLAVRCVVAWSIAIVLGVSAPALAAEFTWAVWGQISCLTLVIIVTWALALSVPDTLGETCGRKPSGRHLGVNARYSYQSGGCWGCGLELSSASHHLRSTQPWMWVLSTGISATSLLFLAVFFGGPLRVSALGLCLGLLTLYMITSAAAQTFLLLAGLVLRAHASIVAWRRHGELPCACHEGEAGEAGALRGVRSPGDRLIDDGAVLDPVPKIPRLEDAEDVAVSALAAYGFLYRAVFDGSGLRAMSYVILGFSFLVHAGLQSAVGLADLVVGVASGWAFCSCAAVRQHSLLCWCLREATSPKN